MALPFRKDYDKYKHIDEDEILGKLSADELKQLEQALEELDPENSLLPAGFRQKDQTTKEASASFDRERLLAYLEKEALEQKDREDVVPFTGEKKVRISCLQTSWCRKEKRRRDREGEVHANQRKRKPLIQNRK